MQLPVAVIITFAAVGVYIENNPPGSSPWIDSLIPSGSILVLFFGPPLLVGLCSYAIMVKEVYLPVTRLSRLALVLVPFMALIPGLYWLFTNLPGSIVPFAIGIGTITLICVRLLGRFRCCRVCGRHVTHPQYIFPPEFGLWQCWDCGEVNYP